MHFLENSLYEQWGEVALEDGMSRVDLVPRAQEVNDSVRGSMQVVYGMCGATDPQSLHE